MTRAKKMQRGTQIWTCPVCGMDARVTQTGRLARHRTERSDGLGDWCANRSPWPPNATRGTVTDSSPWM